MPLVPGGEMAAGVVRVALRRTLRDVKYVEAVRPRRARGLVRDVYRQVERDFGMLAPPIALHSPAPAVREKAKAVLGYFLKPGAPPPAGTSLPLLPAAATDGPGWAPPGGTLADAFARAAAAIEAAGERSVPPRVRDLVRREVKAWDG